MNTIGLALIALSSLNALAAAHPTQPPTLATSSYGQLPLSFEANRGQTDPRVKFVSRGQGYSLFLTDSGAAMSLSKTVRGQATSEPDLLRMTLGGSNPNAQVGGESELPGKVHYFVGSDPARWKSDLSTYAKVRYSSVYPGIDLLYYGNQQQLEYDFVVAPGASPAAIHLSFSGQKSLSIAPNGDLILHGAEGQASFHKPVLYQQQGSHRQSIPGSFQLLADNTVTFAIGSYDHTLPLVIDPTLVYSSYLGGSGGNLGDRGNGITIDSDGNAYITGYTSSPDFPVTSSAYLQTNHETSPNTCAFVTKVNPTGTALIFSTYLCGTGGSESSQAIAIDSQRNVYITGYTTSRTFPTTAGAFKTTDPIPASGGVTGPSPFVTKLSADGSSLVYSTYLDGTTGGVFGLDTGSAIAVNANGNAYVGGSTYANDFPVTSGAFQRVNHVPATISAINFVTELNPAGSALVFSTYLGGTGVPNCNCPDGVAALALDSSGNVFITGKTYSKNFPTTSGAFQTVNHSYGTFNPTGFVTELNPAGTALIYSTYLGGSLLTVPAAIAVDSLGSAYVTGETHSTDFPLLNPLSSVISSTDYPAFVTKLNPSGTALEYSTFLGDSVASGNAIAVDPDGNAYLTGYASYDYFPQTPDATPYAPGNPDGIFIAKLSSTGNALKYSSPFGASGGGPGYGYGLALDSAGSVYITGTTDSISFPTTPGAFQATDPKSLSINSAFASKLSLSDETADHYPVSLSIQSSATLLNNGQPITLTIKVTSPAGTPIPTGNVTLSGLLTPDPQVTLDGTGTATWTSSTLAPGAYKVIATYGGDGSHLLSYRLPQQSVSFTVISAPAQIVNATTAQFDHIYGHVIHYEFAAKVLDIAGTPLSGITVNFAGVGFALSNTSAVTDSSGTAYTFFDALQTGNLVAYASVSGIASPLAIPFRVDPAPLFITVHNSLRSYGAPLPPFSASVQGLVGSDTVAVLPQTVATATTPVGDYALSATIAGPKASNYTPFVTPGNLHISKAPLAVYAIAQTVPYGQTPAPLTQYAFKGFVNGENAGIVSGSPTLTTTVTSTTPVGYYPIQIGLNTLSATNYSFSVFSQPGAIHVTKAPLTLTANNLTIHQGDPIPPFTYTLTGFLNGNTAASSVTGTPSIRTDARSQTRPGMYAIYISPGTLNSANYSFTAVNGILTILP